MKKNTKNKILYTGIPMLASWLVNKGVTDGIKRLTGKKVTKKTNALPQAIAWGVATGALIGTFRFFSRKAALAK